MPTPRALVVRTAGTNCDAEMSRAFELAGAQPALIHVDRLIAEPEQVGAFDLIGFPGGFSYGDDIASGRILAMKLREKLYPALRDAARRGCPMIGICNGFQVLVQVGLLPGPKDDAGWPEDAAPTQSTSLSFNSGGRFIDNWFGVSINPASHCLWTKGIDAEFADVPDREQAMRLPIAHGEGRFVTASDHVMLGLAQHGQIAMTYTDNPNGSSADIAGICDRSGRIFGLMPHPERFMSWHTHPCWTRLNASLRSKKTLGMRMFENAVRVVDPAVVL